MTTSRATHFDTEEMIRNEKNSNKYDIAKTNNNHTMEEASKYDIC